MPAIEGIYNTLINDTVITDYLSTYAFSSSSPERPSIFTNYVIPDDAKEPAILVRDTASAPGGNSEDRAYRAGISIVDVVIYDEKSRSIKDLRSTALRIWKTLHRTRPIVDDYELYIDALYPSQLTDPEGYPGYVIVCNVTVREKGNES